MGGGPEYNWHVSGFIQLYYMCVYFQVCRYEPEIQKMFDFSGERTLQSVDETLKRLGLDYIDIIQIHFEN